MSELIILAVLSSYSLRGVVWCAVAKEAEKMRNILEDLNLQVFAYGTLEKIFWKNFAF